MKYSKKVSDTQKNWLEPADSLKPPPKNSDNRQRGGEREREREREREWEREGQLTVKK